MYVLKGFLNTMSYSNRLWEFHQIYDFGAAGMKLDFELTSQCPGHSDVYSDMSTWYRHFSH